MPKARNLHKSLLLRVLLTATATAMMATAFGQSYGSGRNGIIPSAGARPELLTVFDMRDDANAADRVLAKSAQGLMNSDPLRTDKIYLILNDADAQWLDWLIARQYVLSKGTMHDMEELLRRNPRRDAILANENAPLTSASIAAAERAMLATDPDLVTRFHLDVREDLRSKWSSESEARSWLFDKYRSAVNSRIVQIVPAGGQQLDLLDYQIANRVFTFSLSGDSNDQATLDILTNKFDANIPCLSIDSNNEQPAVDKLSAAGKFLLPVGGLSNLSVWTSFRPSEPDLDELNTSAVNQPRSDYMDDRHRSQWPAARSMLTDTQMYWMAELAPPIYESWMHAPDRNRSLPRDAFRFGQINESLYGTSYGKDRERIWNDYLHMCRSMIDWALKN